MARVRSLRHNAGPLLIELVKFLRRQTQGSKLRPQTRMDTALSRGIEEVHSLGDLSKRPYLSRPSMRGIGLRLSKFFSGVFRRTGYEFPDADKGELHDVGYILYTLINCLTLSILY